MKVSVTQEHIEHGTTNAGYCPIALALRDLDVGAPEVSADGITIYGYRPVDFEVPAEAVQFINDFDKGEPFEFELELE